MESQCQLLWGPNSRVSDSRCFDNFNVAGKSSGHCGVDWTKMTYTPCAPRYLKLLCLLIIASLPKVIWEEGRVAALSHTYAVKFPLVTMARSKFAPKSTPFCGLIPKAHYVPHPWTRPTYDAKRHPDPIRRFSTMHWTDRRTYVRTYGPADRQIVHGKVWRL